MQASAPQLSPAPASGRTYRGRSSVQRDAQRRASVLDAGLHLFGTRGFGPTSMTEVALLSQVAFRYVAKLFPDKESLLEAVFLQVQDQVLAAVSQSRQTAGSQLHVQVRAGLRAALTAYAEDPRRVRISCLEVVGVSQRFEALRRQTSQRFVQQLVRGLDTAVQAGQAAPRSYALLGVGLVGAVGALLAEWALSHEPGRASLDMALERNSVLRLRHNYGAIA